MRVYPWRQSDNQGDRKMVMKMVTSTAVVFRLVGGLLSLGVASGVGVLLVRRFAKRNDSWSKRGAIMSLVGLLIFVVLGGPAGWAGALSDALTSLGDKATTSPLPSFIGFLIRSIAFGFFFQGFAVMMASYVYEVTGSRFLERVKPTFSMKRRFKKNHDALVVNNKPDEDTIAFGQIVDDPIPWRTARYGMICARPFKEMGHGIIVGGNGTGKTVTALSIGYQASVLDASVFYIDFKASLRTLESLKKAAAKAGKKFYSFDLGTGSRENSWYDPLDWKGTPSEKASMIVNSLQFPEDGSAAYYRGVATEWLNFQFEVLQEVGLYAGESSFDFLLETTNPANMRERLKPLRSGDDRQRSLYTTFTERADAGSMKDLTGLRQNLSIVVNAGGERLRPQSAAPAILMSRAVEEGAVVYFGLSPSTDLVALKTIGSLILRNLGVLAGERMRQADLGNLRPIVTLVDEASRLQDRAVVMDNLLATAREGEIYLWMMTQSFATWPKSTVVEMNTNVQTHIAFRVQDVETAEHLVSTLDDVPVLEEMTEDKVRHRAFQGDVKERSGDARTTLKTGPFLVDAPMGITSIENLHAYMWFTGSWTRATIEEWKPKRLKKPDTIRNDAPLVRIVFMDYETEEEPIQGSTFSDLVTSADEITYNMENSTLKRTRRETLTDEDYSHVGLRDSTSEGVQWGGDDQGASFGGFGPDTGFGPDQGSGNEMGGPEMTQQTEPTWDEAAGPRWDDTPPMAQGGNAPTPAQAQSAPTWDDGAQDEESDEPPVSHFYKAKRSGASAPSGNSAPTPQASAAPAPSPAPDVDEFAPDAPTSGKDAEEFASDAPAPTASAPSPAQEEDDDGLMWEVPPGEKSPQDASPVPEDAPAVQEVPSPVEEETTEVEESSEAPVADGPSWADDTPAVETVGGARNTGGGQEVPADPAVGAPEKEGDVEEAPEYSGMPSHDDDPVPSEGTKPSEDAVAPEQDAPGSGQAQGRTPSASTTPETSAPVVGAHEERVSTDASADEQGEGAQEQADLSEAKPVAKKPQGKAPSTKKSTPRAKKNASDDWL